MKIKGIKLDRRGVLGFLIGFLAPIVIPLPWPQCLDACFFVPYPLFFPGLQWLLFFSFGFWLFLVCLMVLCGAVMALIDVFAVKSRRRILILVISVIVLFVTLNVLSPMIYKYIDSSDDRRGEKAEQAWWATELGMTRLDVYDRVGSPDKMKHKRYSVFSDEKNTVMDMLIVNREEFDYMTAYRAAPSDKPVLKARYLKEQNITRPEYDIETSDEFYAALLRVFEDTNVSELRFDQCDGYRGRWIYKIVLCYEDDVLVFRARNASSRKSSDRTLFSSNSEHTLFDIDTYINNQQD